MTRKRFLIAALLGACAAGATAQEVRKPEQVDISVKIVEYQVTEGLETGLSAYFARRNKQRAYGRVTSGNGAVTSADITFPSDAAAGITVFLDRIRMSEGDLEIVLQALEDENRAYIHSRPQVMVMVGQTTEIKTVQEEPFERTVVVGNTTTQVTDYKNAGVTLNVTVDSIWDADANWDTTDDTYIGMKIVAEVRELGQNLTVTLDDQLAGGGASNEISAPEFITRKVDTLVWVRHNQVLMLGGLYRNVNTRALTTIPYLQQAEDVAVGLSERFLPVNLMDAPVSATLGNNDSEETRRELVFFLKAKAWRPIETVIDTHGFIDLPEEEAKPIDIERPRKVIEDVGEQILRPLSEMPRRLTEELTGEADELSTEIGEDGADDEE